MESAPSLGEGEGKAVLDDVSIRVRSTGIQILPSYVTWGCVWSLLASAFLTL